MAGIGFELRRLSRGETYTDMVRAYAYAGVVSSGPWVLSIFAILLLGLLSSGVVVPPALITNFQVSVTWLIALSLIYTGGMQLVYTRYVADRLFERQHGRVVPNLIGAMVTLLMPAMILSSLAALTLFPDASAAYRLLMVISFMLLCVVWVETVLLSGLKRFRAVVALYAGGYSAAVLLGLLARSLGTVGLLGGFAAGQLLLVLGMSALIWREYPPRQLADYDFFRRGRSHPLLIPAGILFNAGVWVDKFIFWLSPGTGQHVLGPLHASVIYDTPTFLAYLTIVPGMAVFLLRMEVDFVHAYNRYFDLVRNGGTLPAIEESRRSMILAARNGVRDIIGTQGLALLVLVAFAPAILSALGISPLYAGQLAVLSVGVMLQLLVMAALNILFYLDDLRETVVITAIMFVSNAILSMASIALGPDFYGYGFSLAMLITALVALALASRRFERLNRETFMHAR
jgi:polysaccharide biosynthesis protein PelG